MSNRIFASPLAKRIAQQNAISLEHITGSGPYGRIVKKDIEQALSQPRASFAPSAQASSQPSGYDLIPNSTMRATIAKRLTQSKQEIPHFYLSIDCNMTNINNMRRELNALSDGEYKISVNDFIIKASAFAMQKVPEANCAWSDEGIMRYHAQDIAVAVALDEGLITPVLRDCGNKGLKAISNEMKSLASRAKDGKLMPEEYTGGGLSISNLGMYGVTQFNAVINPPMACILAVGATEERVIVVDGEMVVAPMMTVTLSSDHRAVDGALGARLMQAFKDVIKHPSQLLL